jgi:hypothetical protein
VRSACPNGIGSVPRSPQLKDRRLFLIFTTGVPRE